MSHTSLSLKKPIFLMDRGIPIVFQHEINLERISGTNPPKSVGNVAFGVRTGISMTGEQGRDDGGRSQKGLG